MADILGSKQAQPAGRLPLSPQSSPPSAFHPLEDTQPRDNNEDSTVLAQATSIHEISLQIHLDFTNDKGDSHAFPSSTPPIQPGIIPLPTQSSLQLDFDPLSDTQSRDSDDDSTILPQATPIHEIPVDIEDVIDGVIVNDPNTPKKGIREIVNGSIFSMLTIITIIIIVIFTNNHDRGLSANASSIRPFSSPSTTPSPSNIFDYNSYIKEIAKQISGEEALNDPTSMEYFAWKYLVKSLPVTLEAGIHELNDTKRILQRYTIALIHAYGASRKPTKEYLRLQAMKPFDECAFVKFYVCNENSEITVIFIPNRKTTRGGGVLATEIGTLSNLKQFSMSNNGLRGTIPSELGNLHHLRILDLNDNYLSGTIPTQIWQLHNLELMILSSNMLVQTIPTNAESLQKLEYLDLSSNSLSGYIPTGLVSINELKGLRLYNNSLSGNLKYFCDLGSSVEDDEEILIVGEEVDLSYNLKTGWIIDC